MADIQIPDSAMVTEYQLHPLSEADAVDWDLWRVRVIRHPNGQWCVMSLLRVADVDGEWHEDGPYLSTAEEWVERYCMPLADALAIADRAQWTLEVGGKTAADVLDKEKNR